MPDALQSGRVNSKWQHVMTVLRMLMLSAAVVVLATVHAQTIPMDKQAFTSYVEKQIRKKIEGVDIKTEDEALTLSIGVYRISLDRIYLVCQQGANKCAAKVQHFINAVADTVNNKTVALNKKDLRLALRSDQYVSQLGKAADYLQKRPFLDGFTILVVTDAPESIQPVSTADLPAFKLKSEELFALASANTLADLPAMTDVAKPAVPGKIETTGFEQYAASRLLFFKQWEDLAKAQDGILLVCAPSTSRLLYISESSTKAVNNLRKAARELMSNSPSTLSDTVLRWTQGGWEVVK